MSKLTVEDVIAKQEITDLVGRYMRGLDRLDVHLLRSTFHDDATTDYGFFQGGPDAFCEMAHGALKDHLANHHMIGQVNIQLEGDIAFGEVYFQAFHRIISDGEERDLFISGRYVDRYERRDDEWKIAFRSEVNDWSRNDPATDGYFNATPQSLRGARLEDASYDIERLRVR
ncbi:MAG: nuclear transport factor 2 family protein [Pseudomonadota bacterium]